MTNEKEYEQFGPQWKAYVMKKSKGDLVDMYRKVCVELRQVKKCDLTDVSGSLRYSEREIDFAYLAGVFNVSGIDGLQKEIERLKGLGKNPHDIIIAAREQ